MGIDRAIWRIIWVYQHVSLSKIAISEIAAAREKNNCRQANPKQAAEDNQQNQYLLWRFCKENYNCVSIF